jgi:hypothetical protein
MFDWTIYAVTKEKTNKILVASFKTDEINPFTYYDSKKKIDNNFITNSHTNRSFYDLCHELLTESLKFHNYERVRFFTSICYRLQRSRNDSLCWSNSPITIDVKYWK